MKDMGEVIFFQVLGDYNITKYGDTLVLTNEGYSLHLKRIQMKNCLTADMNPLRNGIIPRPKDGDNPINTQSM